MTKGGNGLCTSLAVQITVRAEIITFSIPIIVS